MISYAILRTMQSAGVRQKETSMGTGPRDDRNSSEGRQPHPHVRAPADQPTLYASQLPVQRKSPRHAPLPAPAAPMPQRRHTPRQLLVGQRSIIFIAVMLTRMIWLLVQGVRTGQDLRFAAAGAGIYVMALLIASPARRL